MNDQNPQASLPTPHQILAALDRTGFILEYRLHQALEKLGFTSFLNHPFVDSDTGKSREIDVIASVSTAIETSDDNTKIIIDTTIVAECKNYSDPLIVIGRSEEASFYRARPIITFDPLLIEFPNRHPETKGELDRVLSLRSLPSHNTKGFIGSQLIRMHRQGGSWQATNDSIYDAIIYPLSKAVKAEEAETLQNIEEEAWILPSFIYYIPILVTAGTIFTVDVIEDQTPAVAPVSWAPLIRQFSEGPFLMDIVAYGAIEKYVEERVYPIHDDIEQALRKKLDLFNPEWLRRQYGEPDDPKFIAWLGEFKSHSD